MKPFARTLFAAVSTLGLLFATAVRFDPHAQSGGICISSTWVVDIPSELPVHA